MDIREIADKNIWESFVTSQPERTFLQSWNWGEVQKKLGNKIWRLGAYDNDELVGAALIIKITAKRGTFLLIQHGPIINSKPQILNAIVDELKTIAKKEKVSFIRISPLFEKNEENLLLFKNLGFRPSPMHANAYEATLKLDLRPTGEELLANMRKTTRYLIRQAQKNSDFEIAKSVAPEDLSLYGQLNQKVAKYQSFIPFSSEFIKNEFDIFTRNNEALLFFGKYRGEVVASALVIFWSYIAFYHQAALNPKHRKLPVSYLLQWEAIREAKRRGCLSYDFWGFVDPQKEPNHPWAGPTLFKMGFGGEKREYIKTQDLPLNWKYWVNFIIEMIRARKRGY